MLSWLIGKTSKKKLPANFRDFLDPDAVSIVQKLQQAGHESYLVGGCVRDILLGKSPKDFDIATAATPQQVKSLIQRAFIIGKRFRIVLAKRRPLRLRSDQNSKKDETKILFPVFYDQLPDREIQITTFRRDPVIVNGLTNENVFGSAKDDAHRRDFTLNALFLDPVKGSIVDFVGGLSDLSKSKIEVIGDPAVRFKEDPIRILRALRFQARTGLDFSARTGKILKQSYGFLKESKKERIREEVLKILREGHPEKVFSKLYKEQILGSISPTLEQSLDRTQVKDKFFKILEVLAKSPWPSPNQSPLFYLFCYASLDGTNTTSRNPRHSFSLEHPMLQELKVSRAEWEEMVQIRIQISRIIRDPTAQHAGRFFYQGPKHYRIFASSFYCLYVLAKTFGGEFLKSWNAWKKPWEEFLSLVQRSRPHPSQSGGDRSGGGRGRSGGRRRRGRRGGGSGTGLGSPRSEGAATGSPAPSFVPGDPSSSSES